MKLAHRRSGEAAVVAGLAVVAVVDTAAAAAVVEVAGEAAVVVAGTEATAEEIAVTEGIAGSRVSCSSPVTRKVLMAHSAPHLLI
jgi:hypothetical protein